jgi:hypothetical protein
MTNKRNTPLSILTILGGDEIIFLFFKMLIINILN